MLFVRGARREEPRGAVEWAYTDSVRIFEKHGPPLAGLIKKRKRNERE